MSPLAPARTVLLTCLPSAGRSTMAEALAAALRSTCPVELLDSDAVRRRFFPEPRLTKEDRAEKLRRIRSLARLLARYGVLRVVAMIAPYRDLRDRMRSEYEHAGHELIEVHVHAPAPVCAEHDVKGFCRAAQKGRVTGFTGVDDPYEEPLVSDLRLPTDRWSLDECVFALHGLLDRPTAA